MLELDTDKVCHLVIKARELDAQIDVVEPNYGSDAIDNGFRQVLEAYADDATFHELKEAVDNMNVDEQCRLVALTWVGRGDYTADEWENALLRAARKGHTRHTALYLLGTPLLPDYLQAGLTAFGFSCDDMEKHHH